MKYNVSLTRAALNDLYVINDYYLAEVSDTVASNVLKKLQVAIQRLDKLPNRGVVPHELAETGITRYRQIISTDYRIIYRVDGLNVYVVMIIDGRRDVASALIRRQLI